MNGWSVNDKESAHLRELVINSLKPDILSVNETFLKHNEIITVTGYTWFGHNRKDISSRARRGSGGTGFLILNKCQNWMPALMIFFGYASQVRKINLTILHYALATSHQKALQGEMAVRNFLIPF